jgi:hypothetical protein
MAENFQLGGIMPEYREGLIAFSRRLRRRLVGDDKETEFEQLIYDPME